MNGFKEAQRAAEGILRDSSRFDIDISAPQKQLSGLIKEYEKKQDGTAYPLRGLR